MTETGPQAETIRITAKVFQALLKMTGGDVELHTPLKRQLTRALHEAEVAEGGRWCLTLTADDMRTAYDHLEAYCLNKTTQRVRLMNVMCLQSRTFEALYREAEAKRWEARKK